MRKYDRNKSSSENFENKCGYFYENSNGRLIDLNILPFLGIKSNDLFSFKWNYITQGQAVQKIVKFEKAMIERKFEVLISNVSDELYLGNLELFLQLTDVDINNVEMGKLWLDDYYLEGYIFASTKKKRYLNTFKTIIELTIVSENGNWQSEEVKRFYKGDYDPLDPESQDTGYGRMYPYDYKYDYSAPFGARVITNESYLDTDFELVIHGPFTIDPTDPDNNGVYVTIGGNDYRIKKSLGNNDILRINSKTKTAIITHYDGTTENVFAYRDKSWNLFEKIKGGRNVVVKPSSIAVELTLFYERSEPKYTEAKWT